MATACEGWATRHGMGVSAQRPPLAMTSSLEDIQENWTPALGQLDAKSADRAERGCLKRKFSFSFHTCGSPKELAA